jgi:hypothetical protein
MAWLGWKRRRDLDWGAANDRDWIEHRDGVDILNDIGHEERSIPRIIRLILIRLAWNEDATINDEGPIVIDRLRRIWIQQTQLEPWVESSVNRLSGPVRIVSNRADSTLWANVAIYGFGNELIPDSGWESSGGYVLANERLLPLTRSLLLARLDQALRI